jgi:diadenylate cyclase
MQTLQWTLTRLSLLSLLDVVVVTFILFWVLMLVRGTRADQVLRGALLVILVAALAAAELHLTVLDWLVQRSIPALLVAIPVIFQPELRRALEQIGRSSHIINRPLSTLSTSLADHTVDEIAEACERLSRHRYGGLIAIERTTGLQDYVATGVRIDGAVSVDLLVSIFFRNSALHDGAVIVQGDRVAAAACVFPLSENVPEGAGLGTRHRAALGLSEQTDAVVVVVSEETGGISLASNGRLIKGLTGERLRRVLGAFHHPATAEGPQVRHGLYAEEEV